MKTKVAKGSLNPTFNETLQMNVDDPEEPILVEVKDWNFASNISMGKAKIYLNECKVTLTLTLTLTPNPTLTLTQTPTLTLTLTLTRGCRVWVARAGHLGSRRCTSMTRRPNPSPNP